MFLSLASHSHYNSVRDDDNGGGGGGGGGLLVFVVVSHFLLFFAASVACCHSKGCVVIQGQSTDYLFAYLLTTITTIISKLP